MSTLVSIITPSFNQADYIQDTILSIQKQNYRPIEHIVIDGGSTDATIEILKTYQLNSNHVPIKWISEKDSGQANAINKGIKLAQGEIIGWINSDDVYFSKDVIERVVKEFSENPAIDIIHGDVAKIGVNNLLLFIWCIPEFNYERMYVDGKISQPTVFFRSKIFKEHCLREGFLALDYELWLRLGRTYKFKHLDMVMAGDREHPNRISIRKKEELRKSHLQARDEYFPDPPGFAVSWYRPSSFPIRFLFRVKGLFKLFMMMLNPKWRGNLAFDLFIDKKSKVIYRQMFQRIGRL